MTMSSSYGGLSRQQDLELRHDTGAVMAMFGAVRGKAGRFNTRGDLCNMCNRSEPMVYPADLLEKLKTRALFPLQNFTALLSLVNTRYLPSQTRR